MRREVFAVGVVCLVVSLCGGCGGGELSESDRNDKITRVENEIPRFQDPNFFAVLLNSFNNMLNPDFTNTLPKASLDSLMIEYKIPGVCIVVIDDYDIDWMKGYGEIHSGRGIRVTPDTYFEAGSSTKMLTAALVMKLVEMGKIDLDTDVNDYLKSWKIPDSKLLKGKKITTRLLLSHLSGMNEGNNFGTEEGKIPTVVDVLEGRPPATNTAVEIENEPGTVWHYSNFGFIVLQLLLEDHLGRPYADLMQEYIFDPLGMKRSTFAHYDKKAIRDEVIVPHDNSGTPHERDMNATIKAHGDLLASPHDLALFTIELMKAYVGESNSLFSQETAQQMLSVSRRITPEEFHGLENMSYGYGAFLLGEDETLCFMHPGSNNPGTSSMLVANPTAGKGAVIMTNGEMGLLLVVQIVSDVSLVYEWPSDIGAGEN
jgi:CubicO group peptidase (beta-lactamase class C family)